MAWKFSIFKRLESDQKLGWAQSKVNARFPALFKLEAQWSATLVTEGSVEEPSPARRSVLLYGRVAILFRLARFNLSFPFAVLCMVSAMLSSGARLTTAAVPVLLHIAATIYGGSLQRAYAKRGAREDPAVWARRYVIFSLISGVIWGSGAVLWFDSSSFVSEAYLVFAFLGMSTIEFVSRAAYRPAYLAHAIPSLG